jgi:uncharacterized cupin superfamily protein
VNPTNESAVDWTETERGATRFRRKRLADAAGGEALGASLYELPPGGRSWPYHYHAGNEEAVYVLAGEGTLRVGDESSSTRRPLRAGDYVALPAGPESAHRIVNAAPDGSDPDPDADRDPLRYLVVSTMREPDVTVYPDSDKIGVYAGSAPGGDPADRSVDAFFPREAAVDYWTDER